jgi:hypothetical protein
MVATIIQAGRYYAPRSGRFLGRADLKDGNVTLAFIL